jgi:diketogulonate reductase-like aldo/keto reductase
MKTRPFASRSVAAIGQGTWNVETGDRANAVKALRRGLDLGMNHIDTAEMYGNGEAEKITGEAIAGRREEVFLVSKVLPSHASRQGTVEACEQTLRFLRTDHLDCYLLHWRGRFPLAETFSAFEALRNSGKILSWGVSNFDTPDLEEALAIAGPGRIACNQVLYHLRERAIEHAVIPWCDKHDVAVVAYSPFGSGDFPKTASAGGRVLAAIAASHQGASNQATARQVALAFLLRWPSLLTIPKASSPEHAAENAAAADLTLTPDEIAKIESAFPLGRKPRTLPMI